MYIIGSFFNDGKVFSICKALYPHLKCILKMIMMVDRSSRFSLKIDEINVTLWNIHHDYLSIIDHLKTIDFMRVLMYE